MHRVKTLVNSVLRTSIVSNRQPWYMYSRGATGVAAEPFLNGSSSNYVEEMYSAWLEDPKSVHKVEFMVECTCTKEYVFMVECRCTNEYVFAKF